MLLVALLLKGRAHPRALARTLGINHMTVVRRLRALVAGNVLDHEVSGRNKVYRLKRTVEARSAVFMAELHKLDLLLAARPSLRRIVSQVQQDPRIGLAVIFGSHAKGTATKDSDVDLYIETRDGAMKGELERLSSRLSLKTGPYDRENPVIRELERDHVIVKGVEAFYDRSRLLETPP